jgi:hypothetical protein
MGMEHWWADAMETVSCFLTCDVCLAAIVEFIVFQLFVVLFKVRTTLYKGMYLFTNRCIYANKMKQQRNYGLELLFLLMTRIFQWNINASLRKYSI